MESIDGLRYGSAPERRQRILEVVRGTSFIRAGELSTLLGVSEMTVRRDVRLLAGQGLVRAVHGGVCPLGSAGVVGTDFRLRATQERDAKARIAEAAVELIVSGTSIAIDTGTTAMELAALLTPPRRLSVVTPSLPAMVALAGRAGIEVVGLGGVLHAESQGFAGPPALVALRSLHVSQAFIATTAINRGALWCGNQWDAETKRELVAIADEVILLADSSKFSATAMAHIVPMSEVDILVTDDGISKADLDEVRAAGVRVVVVDRSAHAANRTADVGDPRPARVLAS